MKKIKFVVIEKTKTSKNNNQGGPTEPDSSCKSGRRYSTHPRTCAK
ncbi:MAG: hypothetical protein ACRCSK_01175 [Fusobacteriaceae bacterium]